MSDIVSETLKAKRAVITKRIDSLKEMMTALHLNSEDAEAMDTCAKRFNAAEGWQARLAVMDEWKPLRDRWQASVKRAQNQSENYMKWADEQIDLRLKSDDLGREISHLEFYSKPRKM